MKLSDILKKINEREFSGEKLYYKDNKLFLKIDNSLLEDESSSLSIYRRIIFTSKYCLQKNCTFSFRNILWSLSTSAVIQYRSFNFFNDNGEVQITLGSISESTPEKFINLGAEEFFNCIDDVILISEAEPMDEPGPKIVYVNNAFLRMTKYSFNEVFGKTPRILQGKNTSAAIREKMRAAFSRWEKVHEELWNYTKEGEEFLVDLNINPLKDAAGWYTNWIAIQRDITLKNELQRQKNHTEKLVSIGIMASGIAHEINNPLTIVKAKIKGLQKKIAQAAPINKDNFYKELDKVATSTIRIEKIVKNLKILSHNDRNEDFKKINFNAFLLENLEQYALKLNASGTSLVVVDNTNKIEVECVPQYMEQVLNNLINNAMDAVEEASVKEIKIILEIKNHNWFQIMVRDTGGPVNPEIINKFAIPFCTTKSVGRGTGLGLYICKKMIDAHAGKFFLDSRNEIKQFIVEIPILHN